MPHDLFEHDRSAERVAAREQMRQDRVQSSASFEWVVWPVLAQHCPELRGSTLRLVEGRSDLVAYELDALAGIDAYERTAWGLRGMGIRVQWWTNYHSFTVRLARSNGILTEYQKRQSTLRRREEGFLYPYWTIQAYISQPGPHGTLLAVALAKTAELYQYLNERQQSKQPCQQFLTKSGEQFLVVDWHGYRQSERYFFTFPLIGH